MIKGRWVLVGAALASLLTPLVAAGSSDRVAAATPCGAWMRAGQSPDRRADELLTVMTTSQKLQLLHQQVADGPDYGAAGYVPGIPSLCVPPLLLNDAGSGLADEQTQVTAYPAAISQAASWSPSLQRKLGASLGGEAHRKGIDVLLAPDVNIARTPLNGRTSEALGEDPYLSGRTAAAYIRGVQSQHVIATVKHYDANNQETNRGTIDEHVSQRALAEIYQPAFDAAVRRGHVGSVMCSYNKVNTAYACQNRSLLRTDLDQRMGFKGFVVSDWGATHSTVASARNGLDMEMSIVENPGDGKPLGSGGTNAVEDYYGKPLATAVADHKVSMATIDGMAHRVLRAMFAAGLFDHPAAAEPAAYTTDVDTAANRAVALTAAESGSVLLKDARRTLPITGAGKTIAVIGADAAAGAEAVSQAGGSVHVSQPDVVTPLQALTTRAASAGDTVTYNDGSSPSAAAAAAAHADVAIVDIGYVESEGQDLSTLGYDDGACELQCVTRPSDANALVEAVAAANPHTVVVLDTGGPAEMPWRQQVAGILEAWYPGEENGAAVSALLFGDVDPSGKLPITFPTSLSQLPTRSAKQWPGVKGVAHYSEGLLVGYRWYDATHKVPMYPFGFGLSYTHFAMSRMRTRATSSGVDVSYRLTNTGKRAGSDVGQAYVTDPKASREPPQQLAGYQRSTVQPGHSVRVTLHLPQRAFAHWTAARHWTVTKGCYTIRVGDSSRHEPLRAHVARAGGSCPR